MQLSMPASRNVAAAPAADLEVLLIRLGERSFGVPLAQVRYVAPMPADFASRGAAVADHFVFEGNPLTYVSLWDRLGQDSCYAEYEEMRTMLPQRRQDHLDWMAALEDSLRSGASFAKARNPRECAFGKWFYAYRSQDRRLALLLGQFEQPHGVIHGLADKLLGLAEHGQRSEALRMFDEAHDTTLAKLMQLFDAAQRLIVELQRRIAVVVADGDEACALGADGIRDIVTVPAERIKSGKGGGPAAPATAALIVLDERNVVPLIDWRTFCAAGAEPA
ncbi:MAG: CZB domain-containing protein [Rhodocyclaceae bacterium]|nr:CZB domain-containing protein [Rhodocyclaceae bacterium]